MPHKGPNIYQYFFFFFGGGLCVITIVSYIPKPSLILQGPVLRISLHSFIVVILDPF